jgi:hypothetical protein
MAALPTMATKSRRLIGHIAKWKQVGAPLMATANSPPDDWLAKLPSRQDDFSVPLYLTPARIQDSGERWA